MLLPATACTAQRAPVHQAAARPSRSLTPPLATAQQAALPRRPATTRQAPQSAGQPEAGALRSRSCACVPTPGGGGGASHLRIKRPRAIRRPWGLRNRRPSSRHSHGALLTRSKRRRQRGSLRRARFDRAAARVCPYTQRRRRRDTPEHQEAARPPRALRPPRPTARQAALSRRPAATRQAAASAGQCAASARRSRSQLRVRVHAGRGRRCIPPARQAGSRQPRGLRPPLPTARQAALSRRPATTQQAPRSAGQPETSALRSRSCACVPIHPAASAARHT